MSPTSPSYQIIDHTADLGIIVRGPDVKGLFINAALAMTDLMVKGHFGGKRTLKEISVTAEDLSDLIVRWLGEILYLFAAEKLAVDTVAINALSPTQLEATIAMASFAPGRHRVLREIKAVTYHQISVGRANDEWEARVIFDV
jgi:SHS2 domain-containing protein